MIRPRFDPLANLPGGALKLPGGDPLGGGGGGMAPDPASGPGDPAGGPYGPDPAGAGGGQSFDDLLKQARDLVSQAESAAQDDEDRATVTQALSVLNKHFGQIQKDKNAALGLTPVHKGVRAALKG